MLLAKYLEYRAVAMRRDFDSQRPRRQSRPMSTVINATGFTANSSCKKTPPVVRVLELGCGTGLAGLAAAFSFGRRKSGDSGTRSRAALTGSHHRHSNTGEGEKYGLDGCASSPTVEYSVEVVLTDLEYALENARANVHRNASSLKAVGSTVKAMELDWCRPLPDVFIGEALTPSWFPAAQKEWRKQRTPAYYAEMVHCFRHKLPYFCTTMRIKYPT